MKNLNIEQQQQIIGGLADCPTAIVTGIAIGSMFGSWGAEIGGLIGTIVGGCIQPN